jgi:hypothetical protein
VARRSASKRRRVVGAKGARQPDEKRQRGADSGPRPQGRVKTASRPSRTPVLPQPAIPPEDSGSGALQPAIRALELNDHGALDPSTSSSLARERAATNSTVLLMVRDLEAAARRMTGDGLDDVWPGEAGTGLARWRSWVVVPLLAVGALIRRVWRFVRNQGVLVVASAVSLVLMVVLGTVAVNVVAQGAHILPLAAGTVVGPVASSTTSALIVQPGASTPTTQIKPPPETPYVVGAWASNNAPPSSGTVKIYVRVTDHSGFVPVPGASVTLKVMFTCSTGSHVSAYGPVTTDAYGLATIPVTYAGLPVGDPVCVTATVRVHQQTYTATTTFAAS